jgi:hypothetical protein
MILSNPTPKLDYRTKLAIETLREDRDALAKNYGNALLKLIEYERAFYPHWEDCASCSFLHQIDSKSDECHRNCPHTKYDDEDFFICEHCIKYINSNRIDFGDICFDCICHKTKLDDLEKDSERKKLFYDAYDLRSLIG